MLPPGSESEFMYLPGTQLSQLPLSLLYLPGEQVTHSSLPAELILPAAQVLQLVDPSDPENFPAGQIVQTAELAPEKKPLAHC